MQNYDDSLSHERREEKEELLEQHLAEEAETTPEEREVEMLSRYIRSLSTEERLRLSLIFAKPTAQFPVPAMTYVQLFNAIKATMKSTQSFVLKVETWHHSSGGVPKPEWQLSFDGEGRGFRYFTGVSSADLWEKFLRRDEPGQVPDTLETAVIDCPF